MVFEADQIAKILQGKQTQARRPLTGPHRARRARALAATGLGITEVSRQLRCTRAHAYGLLNAPVPKEPVPPWRPGQTLKVVRRTKRGQREACRIRVQAVWRQQLSELTDEQAQREGFKHRQQFMQWWEGRYGLGEHEVWVLCFELDGSHRPRLLAGRHGDQHGYTESTFNALPDEPEAVPEGWQLASSKAAFDRDHALRIERAEQMLRERSRRRRRVA